MSLVPSRSLVRWGLAAVLASGLVLIVPEAWVGVLILDLLQTLWDRADPNGYAAHMTGGLPSTPSHHVLLQLGYGDHQVANITAEEMNRPMICHEPQGY